LIAFFFLQGILFLNLLAQALRASKLKNENWLVGGGMPTPQI
jgi:hypothetical protein